MEINQKCSYNFFCGNHKAANYCSKVADLVKSYTPMGCNIALKVRFFLDSHLYFFTEYLVAVSDFNGRGDPLR